MDSNDNKKKKKKKPRCTLCKKKLTMIEKTMKPCKCGLCFCLQHISDHECGYDHKQDQEAIESAEFAKLDKL